MEDQPEQGQPTNLDHKIKAKEHSQLKRNASTRCPIDKYPFSLMLFLLSPVSQGFTVLCLRNTNSTLQANTNEPVTDKSVDYRP